MFFRPNDIPTAERISKGLGIVEKVSRKVTSSGQIIEEKEKYPLLSLDELTNLDPTELVAFTPRTRPIKTKFLNWDVYQNETNEEDYPPPARRALQVDEGLTRRDRKKPKPQEPVKEPEIIEPPKPVPEPPKKRTVPTNPLAWAKEIKVQWDPENDASIVVYNPYSEMEQLEVLAFAWENNDPFAHKAMKELDYWRVCAWIESRETTEEPETLLDDEAIAKVKKAIEEENAAIAARAAKAAAERDIADDFKGAWDD